MTREKIAKALRNPLKSINVARRIARGHYIRLKYSLFNRNIRIGRNFRVKAGFSIKGPRRVIIGDDVTVDGTTHSVTPWTANKDAEIIIGNNVFLNGTRFSCYRRIEVGNDCILADCRILDTDFHSIDPQRRNDPACIASSPIRIKRNVWVALGCVILRGVTIGENSTISAMSVVYNDVEPNSIYGGNPAVFIRSVLND